MQEKEKKEKEEEKEKKKEKKKKEEEERGGGRRRASRSLLAACARVRISRNVHLLRLVMACLRAKGPLKDARRQAAKAKNVCVILEGSRRF